MDSGFTPPLSVCAFCIDLEDRFLYLIIPAHALGGFELQRAHA